MITRLNSDRSKNVLLYNIKHILIQAESHNIILCLKQLKNDFSKYKKHFLKNLIFAQNNFSNAMIYHCF